MATLVLDTHKAISQLKQAGFEEAKAEAIVNSLQEVDLKQVVSREDVLLLRTELKEDIAKLESGLYRWGFAALLAQGALVVALIELLGK